MLDDIFQPRRYGHEGRVAVWEGPDDPRLPPYFAVYPLDAVAVADAPPVLGREIGVRQDILDTVAHRLGRRAEPHAMVVSGMTLL